MLNFQGNPFLKKFIPVLAAVIVLGAIILPSLFKGEPDLPPEQVVTKSLEKTKQLKSYTYSILMSTTIDGKKQVNSRIKGERENDTRIHFKGTMFDTEIDFYQLGEFTYTKDPINKKWVKLTENTLNQRDIFLNELSPLESFEYKGLDKCRFVGFEKVNGQKLWVYTAEPVIYNPYMKMLWEDFNYKIWIVPRKMLVKKAQITAVSKTDKKDVLKYEVEVNNFNEKIDVTAPD